MTWPRSQLSTIATPDLPLPALFSAPRLLCGSHLLLSPSPRNTVCRRSRLQRELARGGAEAQWKDRKTPVQSRWVMQCPAALGAVAPQSWVQGTIPLFLSEYHRLETVCGLNGGLFRTDWIPHEAKFIADPMGTPNESGPDDDRVHGGPAKGPQTPSPESVSPQGIRRKDLSTGHGRGHYPERASHRSQSHQQGPLLDGHKTPCRILWGWRIRSQWHGGPEIECSRDGTCDPLLDGGQERPNHQSRIRLYKSSDSDFRCSIRSRRPAETQGSGRWDT